MDLKEIEREGEYDQDTLYKMLRELIKIKKRCGDEEPLYPAGGTVNESIHYDCQCGGPLKN